MPHRYDRLSIPDLDQLWAESPDAPMQIMAVMQLEPGSLVDAGGRLGLEDLQARVGRRLSRVPRLRQVVRRGGWFAGRPVWVDDPDFDIARHVLPGSVPAPGTETELLQVVAALFMRRLERTRPLWEIRLLTGLAGGRVALVLKLHHVMADGLAAVQIMASLFDFTTQADEPPAGPWRPEPAPRRRALVADNLTGKVRALGRGLATLGRPGALGRAVRALVRGARDAVSEAGRAPRCSINQPVGAGRRLAVIRLSLAEVRAVAHRHGGKVNDVVLALVAGGLRALLIERGEPVDLFLLASVPVSLRHDTGLGNEVGAIMVPLSIAEPDPGLRLRAVVAATAAAKREQSAAAGTALFSLALRTGLGRPLMRRQRFVNVFVTNVAGPPAAQHVLGARLLDVVPVTPLAGNCPIGFAAFSYDGCLAITAVADAGHGDDLECVVGGARSSWAAMDRGAEIGPARVGGR